MKLKQKIVKVHSHSRRTYESPRIHQQLIRKGDHVSKKQVERLMKEMGIFAVGKKKYRATTDSMHTQPVAENHLNRKFNVNKHNQSWVADITYVYTQESWLYLVTVMDLYSRKIIGWSMHHRITQELVLEALHMALSKENLPGPYFCIQTGAVNMPVTYTNYFLKEVVSDVP